MDSAPQDLATARLVMPYACAVENGALTVRPGPERVFEIAGEREQRLFTTCDPPFSNNCRSLTVYRFEVACGTSRVPWPSVVAAIGRTTAGEASMSKGHMVLMRAGGPTSGHAPSCSERKAVDGGGAGECLPWRMKKPIEKLVLPQGFAPLREVGGRLVDEYAPAAMVSSAGVMALGVALGGTDLAAAGPHQPDAAFDSPDVTGTASPMQVASRSEDAPGETGGWSTSLSIYRGEEAPPELIVTAAVPPPAFGPAPASTMATAPYLPAWLPWIGVLGCVGLAGAYLYRVDRVRMAAPTLSEVTAGTWRGVEVAQRLARQAVGGLRVRMAVAAPAPADAAGELDDPGLASALLQLQAMLARTEAAVSMLSTAVVLREVMQTDLTAIKARLAEAEYAARRGSVPMMKFTAQLRQIARDIDRVQHITESASRSFGQHAGTGRELPAGSGGLPAAGTGRG